MHAIDELEITVDEALLGAPDHTLLARALQAHAGRIAARLGPRGRTRAVSPVRVLRLAASQPELCAKARSTAAQVVQFLEPLLSVPLPSRYAALLDEAEQALASVQHPLEVLEAIFTLRETRRDAAPAFQAGLQAALDLLGDALETAGCSTSASSVFGKRDPAGAARACALGCIWAALAGSVAGIAPAVAAVAGAVAGTAQAAIESRL
jgi:hypothetical protein